MLKKNAWIYLLFLIVVLIGISILLRNFIKSEKELKNLSEKKINGKIFFLKDERRGSTYIEIICLSDTLRQHSLPISWEVKEFNIQIGDSVSKDTNSKTMNFYKQKNGKFIKICEYEF